MAGLVAQASVIVLSLGSCVQCNAIQSLSQVTWQEVYDDQDALHRCCHKIVGSKMTMCLLALKVPFSSHSVLLCAQRLDQHHSNTSLLMQFFLLFLVHAYSGQVIERGSTPKMIGDGPWHWFWPCLVPWVLLQIVVSMGWLHTVAGQRSVAHGAPFICCSVVLVLCCNWQDAMSRAPCVTSKQHVDNACQEDSGTALPICLCAFSASCHTAVLLQAVHAERLTMWVLRPKEG